MFVEQPLINTVGLVNNKTKNMLLQYKSHIKSANVNIQNSDKGLFIFFVYLALWENLTQIDQI